jgi:hypothetical protein
MPEALLQPSQVHVAGHQVGRQRVIEDVSVAFLGREASSESAVPKDTKELHVPLFGLCSPVCIRAFLI